MIIEELKHRKSRLGKLSDSSALSHVDDWISTQCLPLDNILGGKGFPIGRMVEIYGDTSTGKTLLAMHVLAETQAVGGTAVMLDVESTVDMIFAETVGIDVDNLVYYNPDVIEDVFDCMREIIDVKQEVDPDGIMTIVWDSIAATSSDAEVEKVMQKGLNTGYPPTAKEISQMMRVMKSVVAKNRILLLMLNQTRTAIGVMFGDDVATFGGKAVGFYSSIRLLLKQRSKIKDRGNIIGITATAYVAKSKVCQPFGQVTFPILFDVGIDNPGAMLDWLKDIGVIKVRGSWYHLEFADGEIMKFQKPGWPGIYNENREDIIDMVQSLDEEYEDELEEDSDA